jgi:asparagine synthetase B (glutamine-hydrolysing)
MCGIAGVQFVSSDRARLQDLIGGMTRRLAHRGLMARNLAGRAKRNRAGAQATRDHRSLSCGAPADDAALRRCAVTYNGELYNYQELRRDLSSVRFLLSDTEVLLECISAGTTLPCGVSTGCSPSAQGTA